ncbi:hypothetical protein ISU28_004366 [Escherichia coli]|nr:hypothetical protein [Escherichia coli]HCO5332978.1 type VI secretion system ImpA family N-terminal domain-containing protein [Escherichia coli]HCO8565290.1 type VI secretion system ImpA family N-terminal domain-containing protein [Escherichia coli]HDR2023801.1 type VI secretion system ImpA family N-terminal domain-containing protein [Escherichia coli]
MNNNFILELTVNTTNPINNKDFLWLSYNMNNLSAKKNEKSYWLTLEKKCLSLFSNNGYDLQTGAWFCLISAHLYSWEGLAVASWKFADTFVKQKQCWPPLTASQMRTNTLIWYIKNVIPAIQMLSDAPKTDSSLRLLEESLALLTDFENNLFSGKSFIISEVLSELKIEKKSNTEKKPPFFSDLSQHVTNNVSGQKNSHHVNDLQNKTIYSNLIAFIFGVLMALFIHYLEQPEVALEFKRIMPDAFLTEILLNDSGCSEYTSNSTDSWTRLREKIDGFEEILNTIEKNRGYITISKLKTIAHDMKNTLLESPPSLSIRLSRLYNNEYTDKEDIKRELESIRSDINKYKCQSAELQLKSERLLKERKDGQYLRHIKS